MDWQKIKATAGAVTGSVWRNGRNVLAFAGAVSIGVDALVRSQLDVATVPSVTIELGKFLELKYQIVAITLIPLLALIALLAFISITRGFWDGFIAFTESTAWDATKCALAKRFRR
jgi:hypothetical protein